MKISVRALSAGDAVRLHDWALHVLAVDHGVSTAVLMAEFDFLIHFGDHEWVEVVDQVDHSASAA